MNNDLRQQILVSLRAEGLGEADKAREQMARIKDEINRVSTAFGEGTMEAADFKKEVTSLGSQLKFFGDIVKGVEADIEKIDVGLHKLQMTAIKFGDDYAAAMAKAAQASETAELKEAERLAKVAVDYEQAMARHAKATEEAVAKDAAAMAKAQADRDAYAAKVMKAILDTERAAAEASAKINAALTEENAAFERHAQVVVEAETEIERIQQKAAAATVTHSINAAATRASNAKATMLETNAQQHWSSLLQEGVEMEKNAEKSTVALAAAKNKGTEASNKFGYGLLHVSHAFQDMQYGMTNAINNIPLIATSFGMGPGLAGGLMAAGVAGQIFANHFEDVKAAVTDAEEPVNHLTGSVAGLEAKIKEINERPIKLGADSLELEAANEELKKLKAGQDAFNAAKEGKTVYEKQAGDSVRNTFAAEGGRAGEVMEKVAGQYFQELEATSEGLKKQRAIIASTTADLADVEAKMKEGGDLDTMAGLANRRVELLKAKQGAFDAAGVIRVGNDGKGGLAGQARDQAGSLLAGAQAGNRPEDRQNLAERLRRAGEHGLAKDVELANPAEMENQEVVESDFDRSMENMKLGIKVRGEKQVRDKRETAAEKATADARKGEVAKQAAPFAAELAKDKGAGSLDDAILGRMAKGQDQGAIMTGMREQMHKRLTGKVPAELADDVATKLVADAIARVEAQSTAAGGNLAKGAGKVLGARQKAAGVKQAAFEAKAGRQHATAQERALAGQMFEAAGGRLNEQGAMAAAHKATGAMKRGVPFEQAAMRAMLQTVAQVGGNQEAMAGEQAAIKQQLAALHRAVQMTGAQIKRNRAQRPSVLPTF